MSITVYVEGWHEQASKKVRVYMDVEHPSLDADYFQHDPYTYLEEDTGRYYELKTVYEVEYPELNIAEGNWVRILNDLGIPNKDVHCDSLNRNEMDMLYKKLMVRRNKSFPDQVNEIVSKGIFYHYVPGNEYYERQYELILEILEFAKSVGSTVYWA